MSSIRIHFLMTQLVCQSLKYSVWSTTNDAIRWWLPKRNYSHFTANPAAYTKQISYMEFPSDPIKMWSKELILSTERHLAVMPGTCAIDEPTVPHELWYHNPEQTEQNFFLYIHLIEDFVYDEFVRKFIDTTDRYYDRFKFNGKIYSGHDLRGEGPSRWTSGLLSEFDDIFFYRLAKLAFENFGITADQNYIKNVMKPAFFEFFPEDLAKNTVQYLTINKKLNQLIAKHNFDKQLLSGLPNEKVDDWVQTMFRAVSQDVEDFKTRK